MATATNTEQLLVDLASLNDALVERRRRLKEHVAHEEVAIIASKNTSRHLTGLARELHGRKVKLRQIRAVAVQAVDAMDPHNPFWEQDSTCLYRFPDLGSVATIDHIGYDYGSGETFLAVRWPEPSSYCYKVALTPENMEKITLIDD